MTEGMGSSIASLVLGLMGIFLIFFTILFPILNWPFIPGLIVGVTGMLSAIVGVTFSIVGVVKSASTPGVKVNGMGIAGIALNGFGIFLIFVCIIVLFFFL